MADKNEIPESSHEPENQEALVALVNRITNGDSSAEDELVARYRNGVLQILQRNCGNHSIAEDLCQETFALVIQKIRAGELLDPARLSGYVCNIARNRLIEYFRRLRLHPHTGDLETVAKLQDPRPDPLHQYLQKEEIQVIRQVLSELRRERDRQMLFRFWLLDEDRTTICSALGLTTDQFNVTFSRARERFMELYRKRTNTEEPAKDDNPGESESSGK